MSSLRKKIPNRGLFWLIFQKLQFLDGPRYSGRAWAEESCSYHGSQEAEREGRIQEGRYILGHNPSDPPLTRPQLLTGSPLLKSLVGESTNKSSTLMIQSPFQKPTSECVRVLKNLLCLNHNTLLFSFSYIEI